MAAMKGRFGQRLDGSDDWCIRSMVVGVGSSFGGVGLGGDKGVVVVTWLGGWVGG